MLLFDTLTLDAGAKVRFTNEGYMVAVPRVARSGIQLYSGREVGKPEMKVVRVFRPEDEVFNKDSMHSYAHKPLTNDHPPEPVDAENWKDYSTGQLGEDVARDGEFVRVPMVMMDMKAINDYRDGKRELSLGYSCDIQWTPGTAPNGENYDAIQTNIRGNHLALVKKARGGPALAVGDNDTSTHQEIEDMTTVPNTAFVMCDGVSLTMDATSAAVINAYIKRSEASLEQLKGKLDEAGKDKTKDAADHATALTTLQTSFDAEKAKVATLEKQIKDGEMTPAKIDALVVDRSNVIEGAKKVLGDKLVIKDKSNGDIRRQVVDAKMGDAAKGWDDNSVTASFNTIVAGIKDTATSNNGGGGSHRPGGSVNFDHVRDAFRLDQQQQQVSDGDKAYADMNKDLTEAWKNKAA
jgi:hypothetical protein